MVELLVILGFFFLTIGLLPLSFSILSISKRYSNLLKELAEKDILLKDKDRKINIYKAELEELKKRLNKEEEKNINVENIEEEKLEKEFKDNSVIQDTSPKDIKSLLNILENDEEKRKK